MIFPRAPGIFPMGTMVAGLAWTVLDAGTATSEILDPAFRPVRKFGAVPQARMIRAADVNADGKPDLIVSNRTAQTGPTGSRIPGKSRS